MQHHFLSTNINQIRLMRLVPGGKTKSHSSACNLQELDLNERSLLLSQWNRSREKKKKKSVKG